MSIERDTIISLIYVFISLIFEFTLLVKLIRYTFITLIEETINNRFIKFKLSLINEIIIRRIV